VAYECYASSHESSSMQVGHSAHNSQRSMRVWRSKCTKNLFARAMQSRRTKPVTPHKTHQSPRAEPVNHLARFVPHLARTPGLVLREIPTYSRINTKVGNLFRRFVCYREVVSGRYSNFLTFGMASGVSETEIRSILQYSARFRLVSTRVNIRILAGV
jgi:hypothetical protein